VRKILLPALFFFLTFLVLMVPVGVIGSSNLVWGEPDQYGTVRIPGSAVVHLPKRTVDLVVAVALPGRGNETPDLPLPYDLDVRVVPADGGPDLKVERHLGSSGNAAAHGADTQRRVWTVDVPTDGRYRVTTAGTFTSIGIRAQLWLGHGPPLPGALVPVVALGLAVVVWAGWYLVRRWRRSTGQVTEQPAAEFL
jgi:hypothetical protein